MLFVLDYSIGDKFLFLVYCLLYDFADFRFVWDLVAAYLSSKDIFVSFFTALSNVFATVDFGNNYSKLILVYDQN